jgi:hypothetical protein
MLTHNLMPAGTNEQQLPELNLAKIVDVICGSS